MNINKFLYNLPKWAEILVSLILFIGFGLVCVLCQIYPFISITVLVVGFVIWAKWPQPKSKNMTQRSQHTENQYMSFISYLSNLHASNPNLETLCGEYGKSAESLYKSDQSDEDVVEQLDRLKQRFEFNLWENRKYED